MGFCLVVVLGLLIAAASLVVDHGLKVAWASVAERKGSVPEVPRL